MKDMESREERIQELEQLDAGWFFGQGLPLQPGVADRARKLVALLAEEPHIYPTPEGGIQLTWGVGEFIDINVAADGEYWAWIDDVLLTEEDE